VPEEQKEWFLALLRLAQKVGAFMEEHTYYCEFYCFASIRRALLAIGRRWVKAGTIDKVDDIFFFSYEEIETHIFAPEFWDLRYIAERRRKEWEEWLKIPPTEIPPVSTTWDTPEESLMNDVMASMDPIVTKNVIGELPEVRPELKADVYGTRGSHGVAEGVARVIMSLEQLHEVQPGEILIAPNTAPSWTPVFALIKGVVIDRGGMLSHAAIVGREYGIPAVVNTFDATAKINTGDQIRVNGSEGTVYILSKSASQ
jgi:pyruvate,water dikinase